MSKLLSIFLSLTLAASAIALPRDAQQKAAFRKANPCPSSGSTSGPCSGYQVDHKKALMNGGKDRPSNMQWPAEPSHKAKTKQDFAACRGSYSCKHKTAKKRLPWQTSKHHDKATSKEGTSQGVNDLRIF